MKKNLKNTIDFFQKSNNVFFRKSIKITKKHVGRIVKIHNGKNLIEKKITAQMLNLKVGEFVLTRALYEHDKKKKKKKKK